MTKDSMSADLKSNLRGRCLFLCELKVYMYMYF